MGVITSTSPDITAGDKCEAESAASGAIGIKQGLAAITYSGGAGAYTLALPTAGADDGKVLKILDTTGHAHTVTTPANGINGSNHIATFGGAVGNAVSLTAFNGGWYASSTNGVTIS